MSIRVAAAIGLFGVALVANSPTSSAQTVDDPVDLGEATIVSEKREALPDGDGNTVFGLRLPSGASCPGDSEHDQWRVQTFIVPVDVDPGALTYDSVGPVGEGLYALYGIDTNPQVHGLTAPNGGSGLPGLIVGLRSMSFEVFPPGTLVEGTYRIGVVCTYFRETASYWEAAIEVTRDPENKPAEISWRAVSSPESPTEAAESEPTSAGSGSRAGVLVAAAGVAVFAAAYLARRSRRQPQDIRR